MMTKSQMLKQEGRRIAKRPVANGKGASPTPRAPVTGKPGQVAVPKATSRHTSKAKGNTTGPKPTTTSTIAGKNKQQSPAMSSTGPRAGFKGPTKAGGGSGF